MHTITTDLGSGIIHITIAGFLQDADVDTLLADLRHAVIFVRATGLPHSILVDYSEAVIQSQATIAACRAQALNAVPRARRIALYTAGPFARSQARRIVAVRDEAAVFADRAAALDWLHEPDAVVRSATG